MMHFYHNSFLLTTNFLIKNFPIIYFQIKDLLSKAENLLHPTNVYVSRLRTALMQLTGQLTVETMSSMHKEIYSNYKMFEFW